MSTLELYRYMNHVVTVMLSENRAAELKLDEPKLSGKVTSVSPRGIVLSARSTAIIILASDILGVRLKRDRVVTRMVRLFDDNDDPRQHLADRHGTSVTLLRTLAPETALKYHDKIDHTDLGHQHGNRPGIRTVNEGVADRIMERLDGME